MTIRHINNEGYILIKYFEGFRDTPYKCAAGRATIGYGHLLKVNESYSYINITDAEKLLYQDLEVAEKAVCKYIRNDVKDNQFSALVSFTYNLGAASLQRSTLRQKINYGSSSDEICDEFMRWVYSGGKKIKGLFERRYAESVMYHSG